MKRPRPLLRLIDGPPDASGPAVLRRLVLLMLPAMAVANLTGSAVVLVLSAWVVPTPEFDNGDEILLANVIAAAAYVPASLTVGILWGIHRLQPVREWLRAERDPTDSERRIALRAPLRIALVHAVLWSAGVGTFTALNAYFSLELALAVGVTVALGGVTTSAFSYVLTERLARTVAARALRSGLPSRPVMPGVTARALAAWALGSGVAAVGVALVGLAVLLGAETSSNQLAITMLALGAVALVFGLLLVLLYARGAAAPVESVRSALARVEDGDLDTELPVYDGSELGMLQAGFNRMAAGLRERERMRELFGRHVGEDVAREALEHGAELGGERRDVGVLFVDLVGSTELAATRPPEEVVALLNEFFGLVVSVVDEHGGWINKFEGDGALAVFGAPVDRPDAAACALAAARTLGERMRRELPRAEAGIGASAGEAVAGHIGGEHRHEYTVIGDPVNEASRLTELAKSIPGKVVASAAAVEAAGDEEAAHWELGDEVQLRGRPEPTRIATPVQR